MPIIRNARSAASGYIPSNDWGEDTFVQWGGSGIVLSKGGPPRKTAFFEAFPQEPCVSGFIRGEGATIQEAELDALSKIRRERSCPEHRYGRRGYTNGLGVCGRCGATKMSAFKPILELGRFRKPPSAGIILGLIEGDEQETRQLWEFAKGRGEDADSIFGVSREQVLRLRVAGVPVPFRVQGQSVLEHAVACGRAAREKFRAMSVNELNLGDEGKTGALEGIFAGMARNAIITFVEENGKT